MITNNIKFNESDELYRLLDTILLDSSNPTSIRLGNDSDYMNDDEISALLKD